MTERDVAWHEPCIHGLRFSFGGTASLAKTIAFLVTSDGYAYQQYGLLTIPNSHVKRFKAHLTLSQHCTNFSLAH